MMHYIVGSAINAETRGADSQSDFENFVIIMIILVLYKETIY